MRAAAILIPLTTAVLAAPAHAAESVDSAPFEKSIRQELTRRTGVEATTVACPQKVTVKDNQRFTCQAHFVSGDRSPVDVRLRGHTGRYSAKLRNVLLRHLEDELAEALQKQEGTSARFTCPAARRVRRDDRFSCKAEGQDGTITARITQQGGGRVRYVFE